jgi:DNA-binding response OmpR family regulator
VAHLLLIEDDAAIRSALIRALTTRGHAVDSAPDAMSGLQQLLVDAPDAVVLDLGLPDLPGERLLTMIRAVSDVPVVVATARDDEGLVVRLLDAGADDYVVKPFDPSQLEARLRAVLRRAGVASVEAPEVLRVGGLQVQPSRHVAEVDSQPLDLTPLEFDLLTYLARNPGRVVTRRELLREVWQRTDGARTVDVHLSWLRRKLGESAEQPRFLHTVRGVGVRLEDVAQP